MLTFGNLTAALTQSGESE